jgi:hypothetical protein
MASFTVQQVVQDYVASLKKYAADKNKVAVDSDKLLVDTLIANNANRAACTPPLAPIPLPLPPDLLIVNEAAATEYDTNIGNETISFDSQFSTIPYVRVIDTPTPPPTTLTVNQESVEYPGFFEMNGDSPDIALGFVVVINGHQYRKTKISTSPFAPGGIVAMYQQIS